MERLFILGYLPNSFNVGSTTEGTEEHGGASEMEPLFLL